jgi:two-component system response regulator HydG
MSLDDDVDVSVITKTTQARRDAASSRSDVQPSIPRRRVATAPESPAESTTLTVGDGLDALHFETRSSEMRPVFARAARVAAHRLTVLISGEAGVGKEWLARWIHAHSRRAHRPFVTVDCGALPDVPVDRHRFEHARRAGAGVVLGIFDAARGGTLFLDDIGDASPAMQVRLVRIIEERAPRVNADRSRRMDVRVIAATTRDLAEEVTQRRFRPDLYYRLGVKLHIPPLRERPGDLRFLARALLERGVAGRHGVIGGLAPQAMARLFAYDWPGNVRELQEAIEEACVMATGSEIQLEDLPEAVRQGCSSSPSQGAGASSTAQSFDDFKDAYIDAVLLRHQGNRRRAAEALGISLSTLKRRLRRRRRQTPSDKPEV